MKVPWKFKSTAIKGSGTPYGLVRFHLQPGRFSVQDSCYPFPRVFTIKYPGSLDMVGIFQLLPSHLAAGLRTCSGTCLFSGKQS